MKTKTLTSLLASAALAFSVGASETNELEKTDNCGLKIEASMDVLSDYVWRGTICNGNPVWQPGVTLGYDAGDLGAVSANVWQSYDLTHKRGTSNTSRRSCGLQEVDYTLAYAKSIGPVGLEAGHVWYTFPNNNGHSDQELYATVSYKNDIATPTASAYWNYSDSAGTDVSAVYFSFGLSRACRVHAHLTARRNMHGNQPSGRHQSRIQPFLFRGKASQTRGHACRSRAQDAGYLR